MARRQTKQIGLPPNKPKLSPEQLSPLLAESGKRPHHITSDLKGSSRGAKMATLAASQRITVGPFCRKGLRNLLRPATRSRLTDAQPIAVERTFAPGFALRRKSSSKSGGLLEFKPTLCFKSGRTAGNPTDKPTSNITSRVECAKSRAN
jgi:hypothetical protein